MTEKKQALLLFSKPPVAGMVKTRLTREYDGFLTGEQAAEFFRRSLYDVSELSMQALLELRAENDARVAADPEADRIVYDFFVCTTPAESVELMKATYDEIGPWPMEIHYLTDKGATFDDHFDDAFAQIFGRGYEHIVSVGGDIPTMPKAHIRQAFQWLDYFQALGKPGFVQAPCQECGTSLVGFSYNTPIDHQGVYYNLDGRPALDGYMEKLRDKDIPSAFLSPVADIDEATDLAHAISCMRAIALAAVHQEDLFVPQRVLDWVDFMGIQVSTPPNEEHDPRQYIDSEDYIMNATDTEAREEAQGGGENRPLHTTTALCPHCLTELKAEVYADAGGAVWMERTCPDHGKLATRMWPDADHYEWLRSLAFPKTAPCNTIPATLPCPHGCGTCARHQRRGTLLEIEVTRNCNLHCPVCFMSAETGEGDPTLEEINVMYDVIERAVGIDGAVQITGGEPTCRKDLPEIIRMGREKGFWGIEVNTNGLVIAARDGYLEELMYAGLTGVYLSFDGLTGDVYEGTCGRDILDVKLKVIERCREVGIQVVLSVAVVAGLNDHQLGDLLRFCLDNSDVVAGLALQPAFTSGRFDAERAMPMSAGDVIFQLAEQSDGLFAPRDIWPLGCSNPLCDTGVFLVRGEAPAGVDAHPSGFYPATRAMTLEDYRSGYSPDSPQGSVFLDILDKQGIAVETGLSIIIMNYMDAVSMDTQRLRECSMMVTVPDGRAIPFCSYHLTDANGRRVYPPWCKEELR